MTSARRSAGGGSSQGSPSSRGGGSPGNSNTSTLASGSPGSSHPGRVFCVSVVGLSGTERDKGTVGSGKSCFCNRFVRPSEDDYFTDHISTLSQVDFSGSPVINNDHWLYWGDRSLLIGGSGPLDSDSSSQRMEWGFRVVEQTEFVDDESFQPLKATGNQKDGYVKRAASSKLYSPDKLMYVCKGQLGLETEYEQKQVNSEGRIGVDGFICVFDISAVPKRSFQHQTDYVLALLQQIGKNTKKPVVLVLTKCDEGTQEGFRESEKLISRKELRGLSIPVVETSSHNNINIETAFIILGYLIDSKASRGVSKPKIFPFREASKFRKEVLDVSRGAYARKLKLCVQDYRVTWHQWTRQFGRDPDFIHFCELFGAMKAQKLFRIHQKELREQQLQKRLDSQSGKLPEVRDCILHWLSFYT